MTATPKPVPRWVVWPILVIVFFAAMAPTLTLTEFSSGLENLNIATALELRRDHKGSWLVPTLEGEVRVKKPPLTAWITATFIRQSTISGLSSPDSAIRARAADALAWDARWPALLAACLMLVGVYELGRACADPWVALVAAAIAGSNLMFLRFGKSATIDVYLGLFVTIANVFLAHAILHRRRWIGFCGAGVFIGLAILAKGPVGLAQTIVPAAVYAIFRVIQRRGEKMRGVAEWIGPIVAGGIVMIAVALPWYLYIYKTVPGAWHVWMTEATEDRGERPSKIYAYLAILLYMLPWTVSFIGGIIESRRGMILALCFAIVPLVAMTFYKDRKERYVYPVVAAASVVAACGMMTLARKRERWNALDKAAVAQQWIILVITGVIVPAIAATGVIQDLRTLTGEPWLTRGTAVIVTIALALVISAGILVRARWPEALTLCTVIVMLTAHAVLIRGYGKSKSGVAPLRPLADAIHTAAPDATTYFAHYTKDRVPLELAMHLNRVTPWISTEQFAQLKPGPNPIVVITEQDPKKPAPPVPDERWRLIHKVRADNDWWYAYVLKPAGN